MTKEQFENYNGLLHCKTCNKYVPKIHMNYKKVHKNGDVTRCNVCEWLKRHKDVLNIISFDEDDIVTTLHFFIYEESYYINDLANKLNKTIDEIITLYKALKIGNKKCFVKTNCEYCEKEIEKPLSVYLKNENTYCSLECYWNDKPNKILHGKDSPFYNKIKTHCTNCGKDIDVIPHRYNIENSFGENHNFCSKECYWEFRSKHYVGDKSHMTGFKFTEEQLEKMKTNAIKNSRNSNRFNSGVQLKVDKILNECNINYEREYIIKYYAVDNYLYDQNLIIEVMGDYWHGNPLKYNENKYMLNNIQQKTILKDKQKASYILNHKNIKILYLWETDIDKNPELCKKLILSYIQNNGHMDNYNSFNWKLKGENLKLCDDIIIPYQDMKSNEYNGILKK